MEIKETINRLHIRDYFRYEPVVEYDDETVRIISTHNEMLSNELLSELTFKNITLKSVDTNYEHENDFGVVKSTMWEFAPMKSLL